MQALAGTPNSERSYESAGELYLEFKKSDRNKKIPQKSGSGKGNLFLWNMKAKTRNIAGKYWPLFPEQVMVVHMKAEGQESLSFSCHFERSHNRTDEVWANGTKAGFL